jgi:HEPN domain-containing protein
MFMDITRGVAALISVWSLGSQAFDAKTATVCHSDDNAPEFLDEAQTYINLGRHHSAAILAGDALESTLRKLCLTHSVEVPSDSTLDNMNAELARMGIYDDRTEQRLSAASDLREKANCGLWSEVSKDDVETMVAEVRTFAAEYAAAP